MEKIILGGINNPVEINEPIDIEFPVEAEGLSRLAVVPRHDCAVIEGTTTASLEIAPPPLQEDLHATWSYAIGIPGISDNTLILPEDGSLVDLCYTGSRFFTVMAEIIGNSGETDYADLLQSLDDIAQESAIDRRVIAIGPSVKDVTLQGFYSIGDTGRISLENQNPDDPDMLHEYQAVSVMPVALLNTEHLDDKAQSQYRYPHIDIMLMAVGPDGLVRGHKLASTAGIELQKTTDGKQVIDADPEHISPIATRIQSGLYALCAKLANTRHIAVQYDLEKERYPLQFLLSYYFDDGRSDTELQYIESMLKVHGFGEFDYKTGKSHDVLENHIKSVFSSVPDFLI